MLPLMSNVRPQMIQLSGNDFWTALAAVLAAFTLVAGSFLVGRAFGRREMRREVSHERELKRYEEIYAPIVGMFARCHITTATFRRAPYLKQRLRNANRELKARHYLAAGRALFDKQDSKRSAEVEYGHDFPLNAILSHLLGKEHFADPKLLGYVRYAHRIRCEVPPSENDLTEADLELFDYVYDEYTKLAKRFAGA